MSENNNFNNLDNNEISESTENFKSIADGQEATQTQDNKSKIVGVVVIFLLIFLIIIFCITNSKNNSKTSDIEETTATQTLDLKMDKTLSINDVSFKINSKWSKLDENDYFLEYLVNDCIFVYIEHSETPKSLLDAKYDAFLTLNKGDRIVEIDRENFGDYESVDYSYRSDNGENKLFHHMFMFYYHEVFYRVRVFGELENENKCEKIFKKMRSSISLDEHYDEDDEDDDYYDDYDDEDDYSDTEETKSSIKYYEAGQYLVGSDIPAGIYIAYPIDNYGGYYEIDADANGNDIIANDNFDVQSYFSVKNGEYIELSNCTAYALADKRKTDTSSGYVENGQYLVGDDIPAGEYKVTATDGYGGYYEINSDANGDNIVANDNFENSAYVSVTNGQYLTLSDAKIKLN